MSNPSVSALTSLSGRVPSEPFRETERTILGSPLIEGMRTMNESSSGLVQHTTPFSS